MRSNLKQTDICPFTLDSASPGVLGWRVLRLSPEGKPRHPERHSPSGSMTQVLNAFKDETRGALLVSYHAAYDAYRLMRLAAESDLRGSFTAMLDPFYMSRYLQPGTSQTQWSEEDRKSLTLLGRTTFDLLQQYRKRGFEDIDELLPHARPRPITRAYRPIYQVLFDAYLRHWSVAIDYPKTDDLDRTQSRIVDIYGFRSPFVVAYCHLRKDFRTFRLERIQDVHVLPDQSYEIPKSFDLGDYWAGLRRIDLTH